MVKINCSVKHFSTNLSCALQTFLLDLLAKDYCLLVKPLGKKDAN